MSALVMNPYSCHSILTTVVADYMMHAVSGFYMVANASTCYNGYFGGHHFSYHSLTQHYWNTGYYVRKTFVVKSFVICKLSTVGGSLQLISYCTYVPIIRHMRWTCVPWQNFQRTPWKVFSKPSDGIDNSMTGGVRCILMISINGLLLGDTFK